ncbi:nucleotidyltransferase domain-containing protein [Haemophilus haemolyticus]|uniref:nucleotidyltransferase domain-containing protein n=1 Tax=Haemophilus haemolyticus TaxID=726 RepID=UPI001127790D|nr:nucleotidyltransferase domain-containing protein [Haemophilus haemolyticus]TPH26342.1 nucleotidyltransferase domain-containing protein [Haemophilus haemolyticus]
MHAYVFGSLCRGELDNKSDIDILIISDEKFGSEYSKYSVYSYEKIRGLWLDGNPFAWHLYLESKLVFSSEGNDFLRELGEPSKYSNMRNDFYKFKDIYTNSLKSLELNFNSVFNLSCIFLAIRNISTCYSLYLGEAVFSRRSMIKITPAIDIPIEVIETLEKCRILSTRGIGDDLNKPELENVISHIDSIDKWFDKIEGNINE